MDQSNNNQDRRQNEANRSKLPKGDAHKQPAKKPYQPKDSKQGWYPDKKHPGAKGPQAKHGDKMPPKMPGVGFGKGGSDYKPGGNKPMGAGQGGGMPPYGGMQQPGGMGPGMQQPGGMQQQGGMQQPGNMPPGYGMQQPGGMGPGMQQQGMPPWMQNNNGPNGPMQPQQQQPQQPMQPQPGPGVNGIPRERSFIENILRLNTGKEATFYMTFENNEEWNAMVFEGIVREAGKDHIVVEDPETGNWYLLLMIYLDYVQFYQELNYEYPFA
ncbi:spore coat protein GerQ [Alkalibacillus silvisoli]|uniref:Spore coat protein GerQ n=1 Tax=Alkalibacillus silvisoli TaxID=392823 RepID=A0ABN0ZL06_9BACI